MIHGTDRPKVKRALAKLRTYFSKDAIESFDASMFPAVDVIASCSMMGLFADKRLVVVQGADQWKVDDVNVVLDYLKSPEPATVLVLLADKLAGNSRLLKAFQKPRLIEALGPDENALPRWVVQSFAKHGATADTSLARRLLALTGTDSLERIESDIARIAAYAGSEPVSEAMIDELSTFTSDAKVWAITDAWATRDRPTVLRSADELLANGEEPVRLAMVLARHIRAVHETRCLLNEVPASQAAAEIGSRMNARPWVAKKYVHQAQKLSMSQADASLARIALLEAELKGAAALASQAKVTVFHRALCELV